MRIMISILFTMWNLNHNMRHLMLVIMKDIV